MNNPGSLYQKHDGKITIGGASGDMGINFRFRDFGYPFSILKLKRKFDRNQWLTEEDLCRYQESKLRQIVRHSYENIPYYRKLFTQNKIGPDDVKTLRDLKAVPFLTKDLLRTAPESFVADDVKKYRPTMLSTSGTTGGQISFFTDKQSNILEFVYYWRLWGWAGYKLGNTFAELSAEYFAFFNRKVQAMYNFDPLTRRLVVNSLLISPKYLDDFIGIFRKFRPLFLKGLPSNLYMFALVLNERKNHGISFRGIFSQGENLQGYQRELIEQVFSCRVFDSYGHMERTVAISQCPSGSYHMHLDYGIMELEEPEIPVVNGDENACVREIVGTSLYNLSMPLIRYRTGDLVKLSRSPQKCSCNRGFPAVISILGRDTDVIITPDRRAVTALYTVFDRIPGIIIGQIIQEDIDHLLVKIVCASGAADHTEKLLISNLRGFVGTAMDIKTVHTTIDGIKKDNLGKFKVIVSKIPSEKILD